MFGLLSLFVVPAPNARTAIEVSGTVASVSQPHPDYGDIGIVLEGGQSFYVNRADQVANIDWEQMLSDLHPGDMVYLTVVPPLAWQWMGEKEVRQLPVAGIRTASVVYMDPAISAERWTAQAVFSRLAHVSLVVLVVCLLPELLRMFRTRPPADAVGM
jgi:hypothetical protein